MTSLFGNTLEVGFAYETASDRVETKFNSLVHLILEEDEVHPNAQSAFWCLLVVGVIYDYSHCN